MLPVKLPDNNAQRVLEHMGAHILFDSGVDRTTNPCGLCLLSSQACRYFVGRGKGSKASRHVDSKRSTCSNVPIPCPLCPDAPAVWRYNLQSHFLNMHSAEAVVQYHDLKKVKETRAGYLERA